MKLKLEIKGEITFLSISDHITPQHISVLKAGLNRIISDQNKRIIVLDFSSMPSTAFQPALVMQDIEGLQIWAAEAGAQILIVSSVQGWGDVSTCAEAIEILNSKLGQLRALESRLRLQARALEKTRSEIDARLTKLGISDDDLKKLRRDNSQLKTRIAALEEQIRQRIQARSQPFESGIHAKAEAAGRTLVSVLEQEGVLPVI